MAYHTLPKKLPGDWLASFKLPSRDGVYEQFLVVHPANSTYDPFVVHTATYYDEGENKGKWAYSSGTYCRTLERAQVVFVRDIGRRVDGVTVVEQAGAA